MKLAELKFWHQICLRIAVIQDAVTINQLENGLIELKFKINQNEKGIIYRLSAVLLAHDCSVIHAKIKPLPGGDAEDTFLIKPPDEDKKRIEKVWSDFEDLQSQRMATLDYLNQFPDKMRALEHNMFPSRKTRINIEPSTDNLKALLTVTTPDRLGVLLFITQTIYLMSLDIANLEARTEKSMAIDSFSIQTESGESIKPGILDKLKQLIFMQL